MNSKNNETVKNAVETALSKVGVIFDYNELKREACRILFGEPKQIYYRHGSGGLKSQQYSTVMSFDNWWSKISAGGGWYSGIEYPIDVSEVVGWIERSCLRLESGKYISKATPKIVWPRGNHLFTDYNDICREIRDIIFVDDGKFMVCRVVTHQDYVVKDWHELSADDVRKRIRQAESRYNVSLKKVSDVVDSLFLATA